MDFSLLFLIYPSSQLFDTLSILYPFNRQNPDIRQKIRITDKQIGTLLTGRKFHEICDNQSRTVTIVKVKDSSEILGGYNPIKWKSDEGYGTTKDSFIFSFDNNVST